jgi:hypothetical protein
MGWANIIYNKLNVFNVQSPSTNTSCDENVSYSVFEILNCEFSVCLVHTSMQRQCFINNLMKFFEKIISFGLFFYKYQNRTFVIPFTKQLNEFKKFLFFVFEYLNPLFYTVTSLTSVTNYYFYRSLKLAPCKCLNTFWKSCTEHNDLFVLSTHLEHKFNLGLKSHVKHPISLVKNTIRHPSQICDPTITCC